MPATTIRGTPIYVTRGDERIALVPEVQTRRLRFQTGPLPPTLIAVDPWAVYVIDRHGVRRLPLASPIRRWLKKVPLALLAGPALYLLARWSKRNG